MSTEIPENLSADFLRELEKLKKEVQEIKQLQGLGNSVADEVQKEIAKKFEVSFLKDKVDEYKVKTKRGHGHRPLLQSEIEAARNVSRGALETARRLGVNYMTYRKYAKMYGIHRIGPTPKGIKKPVDPNFGKYPIKEILEGKHPNYPIYRLKDKIIRAKVKDACCELCGYRERRITDGKMPLLLNFEDGNQKNHKLENIKLLCYNCSFTSGKGFIHRGMKRFDPDVMQGSKDLFDTRF